MSAPKSVFGARPAAQSMPVTLPTDNFAGVGPLSQASTNATAVVVGSGLDARNHATVCYTIAVATHDVDWSVFGANASDYSDEVAVLVATKVVAAAHSSYTAAPAPYSYYRVKIIDDAGGTHGTATVSGIVKG